MDTAQRFSLGVLVSPDQTSAPREVQLKLNGRGIFCQLTLEYGFEADDPSVGRVFALDRPWNSVLTEVLVNGEPVDKSEPPSSLLHLPPSLKAGVEEVLQEGSAEGICCYLQPGTSLRTLKLTFVFAGDVLWHRSLLNFFAAHGTTRMDIDVSWDLAGLTGAGLSCTGQAAESRFSQLDGSHFQWSETLQLERGQSLGIQLQLDEKKAASLCLFSGVGSGPGCGAVVVVAPVRPQLQRKPVKVAVLLEIRNPQEGLITRELIDKLRTTLNPDDHLALFVMGSSVARCLMPWREAGQINEDILSQLLEPSQMGKPQYFWESFQQLVKDCEGATHLLLSTPGPRDLPPEDFSTNLPIFSFVTARKPNCSTLGELSGGTGSFVGEHSVDGVDSFLQRLNVRLSPPLLREFRLEGWGLEQPIPARPTQVFMDKPTLVFGRYEGLLPQTVTLAGVAPGGQKLGQRVKVENFSSFSLAPLHDHASRRGYDFDHHLQQHWLGSGLSLFEVSRPVPIGELFAIEEAEADSAETMDQPPTMEPVSTAVAIDEEYFGDQGFGQGSADAFFNGAGGDTLGDDIFSNPPSLADTLSDGFFTPGDESDFGNFSSLPEREAPSIVIDEIPPMDFNSPRPSKPRREHKPEARAPKKEDAAPPAEPEIRDDDFPSDPENAVGLADSGESYPTREDSSEREAPSAEKPAERSGTERSTVAVRLGVPEWVKRLVALGGSQMQQWLNTCPIDTLSLGLADTEEGVVSTLLEQISGPKRAVVEIQIEWGRLLPESDREKACQELEKLLA